MLFYDGVNEHTYWYNSALNCRLEAVFQIYSFLLLSHLYFIIIIFLPVQKGSSASKEESQPPAPKKARAPAIPPGATKMIFLAKTNDSFGFTVFPKPGATPGSTMVVVKQVAPDGPADVEGSLEPGDQLLSINSQSLVEMQFAEAEALINSASGLTMFNFCKKPHLARKPVKGVPAKGARPAAPLPGLLEDNAAAGAAAPPLPPPNPIVIMQPPVDSPAVISILSPNASSAFDFGESITSPALSLPTLSIVTQSDAGGESSSASGSPPDRLGELGGGASEQQSARGSGSVSVALSGTSSVSILSPRDSSSPTTEATNVSNLNVSHAATPAPGSPMPSMSHVPSPSQILQLLPSPSPSVSRAGSPEITPNPAMLSASGSASSVSSEPQPRGRAGAAARFHVGGASDNTSPTRKGPAPPNTLSFIPAVTLLSPAGIRRYSAGAMTPVPNASVQPQQNGATVERVTGSLPPRVGYDMRAAVIHEDAETWILIERDQVQIPLGTHSLFCYSVFC